MKPFLEVFAQYYLENSKKFSGKTWIIIPNAICSSYLHKYFTSNRQGDDLFWSPSIISFGDFIDRLLGLNRPDRYSLILELWDVFKIYQPNEGFEKFYTVAERLLQDFDEIDANFLDTKRFFEYSKDWLKFSPDPTGDMDLFPEASFWKMFSEKPKEMRRKFLELWDQLGAIYEDFKKNLFQKRWLYPGLSERTLLELLTDYPSRDNPFTTDESRKQFSSVLNEINYIFFVGFNRLSNCQGMIMRHFAELNDQSIYPESSDSTSIPLGIYKAIDKNGPKSQFWWDYDPYFMDQKTESKPDSSFSQKKESVRNHEAGKLLIQNFKKFNLPNDTPPEIFEPLLARSTKNITIIDACGRIAQSKGLYYILGETLNRIQVNHSKDHSYKGKKYNTKDSNLSEMAVILPDSALLFPTLSSIPSFINEFNVTFRYSLRNTPLHSLLNYLYDLQLRRRRGGFHYKNINVVLSHPLLRNPATLKIQNKITEINPLRLTYSDIQEINSQTPTWLLDFFQEVSNTSELCQYLRNCIENIALLMKNSQLQFLETTGRTLTMEADYFYQFYAILTRIEDTMEDHALEIPLHLFGRIFNQMVSEINIPFVGENSSGMQIMSVSNSQLLDFEGVIYLSMNEGTFPPTYRSASFIPETLRRMFSLPIRDDDEADLSYHFYRLMRRSSELQFIYNGEEKEGSGKSRFLLQLIYEYVEKNPQVKINYRTITTPLDDSLTKSIEVTSGEKERLQLQKVLQQNGISAFLLNTLLSCKLKFYFKYLLRLTSPEKINEDFDNHRIGNLLHLALHYLYKPLIGKEITSEDLNNAQKQIIPCVDKAICDEFKGTADVSSGQPFLAREIMIQICHKFLSIDQSRLAQGSFIVLELEKEYSVQLEFKISGKNFNEKEKNDFSFPIIGVFDRLDSWLGGYLIIDYKTGKKFSFPQKRQSIEDLFSERDVKKSKHQNNYLQGLLYAYILAKDLSAEFLETKGIFTDNSEDLSETIPVTTVFYLAQDNVSKTQFITSTDNPKENTDQVISYLTKDTLNEFEKQLQNEIGKLFEETFVYSQTKSVATCITCEFNSICRRA